MNHSTQILKLNWRVMRVWSHIIPFQILKRGRRNRPAATSSETITFKCSKHFVSAVVSYSPEREHHLFNVSRTSGEEERTASFNTSQRFERAALCGEAPVCQREGERDAIHAAQQKNPLWCAGVVEGVLGGFKQPVRHARGCCWHRRGVCFSPAMCGVREKKKKSYIVIKCI